MPRKFFKPGRSISAGTAIATVCATVGTFAALFAAIYACMPNINELI